MVVAVEAVEAVEVVVVMVEKAEARVGVRVGVREQEALLVEKAETAERMELRCCPRRSHWMLGARTCSRWARRTASREKASGRTDSRGDEVWPYASHTMTWQPFSVGDCWRVTVRLP